MWSSIRRETSQTSKRLQPSICFSIAIKTIPTRPTTDVGDASTNAEMPTPLFSTWATRMWVCLQFRHRDISNFSDRNLLFSVASRDLFFYTQASGDYIGMAIRSNVLFCVYKLGGVVHEVETVQITTTSNVNSSDFDRVVFHRYSKHRRRKRTRTLSLKVSRGTEPHFPPPPSVIRRLSLCVCQHFLQSLSRCRS